MTQEDDHRSDFEGIMEGLRKALAYQEGRLDPETVRVHHARAPAGVDVKSIRARLGLSQAGFAQRFGFAKRTVQDWEQRRRRPEASARVLLTIIDREPEAVERALTGARDEQLSSRIAAARLPG